MYTQILKNNKLGKENDEPLPFFWGGGGGLEGRRGGGSVYFIVIFFLGVTAE